MLWTECARDEAVTESALAKRPMEESTSNQVIGTTMHSQAGLSTGDYHSRDISHNADDDTRTPFGNAYMVEVQGHLSDENMSRAISVCFQMLHCHKQGDFLCISMNVHHIIKEVRRILVS